jgi:protein TonB
LLVAGIPQCSGVTQLTGVKSIIYEINCGIAPHPAEAFPPGIAIAFSFAGSLSPEGIALMKEKLGIALLGLALVLAGALAAPRQCSGPDAVADSAKRKVKTRVMPDYPSLAKQMKVTGRVKIETTIAADGHVSNTKVVGGSPLLVNSALDAVKKWRFEPAAKESTETIEFDFTGQN